MTTQLEQKKAILDTVHLFETMYDASKDHSPKCIYFKPDFILNVPRVPIENNCYLCNYSWLQSGKHLTEMCELCPCSQYLGKRCFELNMLIGSDILVATTIKWSLKQAYKIASLANVLECDFTYWKEIRYDSRSK